ncbi:MAG TPA: hypothetical protein VFX50_01230, partial [Gemmatimonadales bacterium]|nr:hypothetical protein [Gemmatimonadales bacterium]
WPITATPASTMARARAGQSSDPATAGRIASLDRELAAIGATPAPPEPELRARLARATEALDALAAHVMP